MEQFDGRLCFQGEGWLPGSARATGTMAANWPGRAGEAIMPGHPHDAQGNNWHDVHDNPMLPGMPQARAEPDAAAAGTHAAYAPAASPAGYNGVAQPELGPQAQGHVAAYGAAPTADAASNAHNGDTFPSHATVRAWRLLAPSPLRRAGCCTV